jgi:hypothetical protein
LVEDVEFAESCSGELFEIDQTMAICLVTHLQNRLPENGQAKENNRIAE